MLTYFAIFNAAHEMMSRPFPTRDLAEEMLRNNPFYLSTDYVREVG